MKDIIIRKRSLGSDIYVNLNDILELLETARREAGSINAKHSINEIIRSLKEGEND